MSLSKILVFGATGSTGRILVERALARGHEVTAFVRTPSKLDLEHPSLTVVQGDATDADAVSAAIAGHDAVVSTLGMGAYDTSRLRARATEAQLNGMRTHGVTRIVSLSCLGVGDSYAPVPWHLKYLLFPLYLRNALADHAEQEALLRGSGLEWVVVRPPHLTNEGERGDFVHGFTDDLSTLTMGISRTDVADFMLDRLEGDTYLREAVGISYPKASAARLTRRAA